MRKRTYTAIDEPVSCVSKWNNNLQNVLHTDKRKLLNTDKNESSHIIDEVASNDVVVSPLSVLDTPGSSLGVTRPDSLRGLKNKPASDPIASEDDGVPLTTIHNLVGTTDRFGLRISLSTKFLLQPPTLRGNNNTGYFTGVYWFAFYIRETRRYRK
jgi:hypothetical protein